MNALLKHTIMKHYIYKTTNLINNKIYIGYHHSDDIENDKYLGSGEYLLKAIKKYRRKNFKREILFEFDNQEDAYNKENELVDEIFVKRKDTYNTSIGGKGWLIGIDVHNKNKITVHSPITDKNYYINENDLQKFLDDGYILGNKSKGKRLCVKKDDTIKYINPIDFNKYESEGWIKSNTTDGKICMTHSKTKKLKYVDEQDIELYKQNGYILGNLKSGVNKNTIYISKDCKNKRINESEIEQYLSEGWVKKRYQKELKIKRMHNCMTKELKNIPIEQIDQYISKGWKLGTGYSTNGGKKFID